ncbi:MAG: Flp pilus assembly protein CpaB [Actinomycetota bacterium]|nr:Flp pilus assembly protein CpaB [Actinomycetota bacterium]
MDLRRRWPFASKVFGGLAIASAAASFLLVRGLEARLAAAHPSTGAPVGVVIAAADATRGAVLDADMLRVDEMPSAFVPPGALTSVDGAVGRVLVADVSEGEILTRTRVSSGSGGPVAALLPPGLRAVDVTVNAPADDLAPGDHVDVLAAFGTGGAHTEIAGEGLEVLRVTAADDLAGFGSSSMPGTGGGGAEKTRLLLLVSPTDAQRLAFAQAFASLSVAIVPAGGDDPASPSPSPAASPP